MVIKPTGLPPVLSGERLALLNQAVAKIDEEISANSQRISQKVLLSYLANYEKFYPHDWLHNELLRLYSKSGWQYVSLYQSPSFGSRTTHDTYIYLSSSAPLVAYKESSHQYRFNGYQHTVRLLAGSAFVVPATADELRRQNRSRIVGGLAILVAVFIAARLLYH